MKTDRGKVELELKSQAREMCKEMTGMTWDRLACSRAGVKEEKMISSLMD